MVTLAPEGDATAGKGHWATFTKYVLVVTCCLRSKPRLRADDLSAVAYKSAKA